MKKEFKNLLITLLIGAAYYYFILPPINIQSLEFILFVCFILGVYLLLDSTVYLEVVGNLVRANKKKASSILTKPLAIIIALLIFIPAITALFMSPLFQAKEYYKRIVVKEDTNFVQDVPQVNFNHFALIDKESSKKLGDRVMGEIPELVSQFRVSNNYTQINYKEEIVRVTPLEYADFIKWLTNRKEGTKGYIKVSSTNGNASLEQTTKGLKYVESAFFNEDLKRKVRFDYPTMMFDSMFFEIDDDNNPYWIIPAYKVSGFEMRKDVKGAVILNAITGESKYYNLKEIPEWVDHVFPSELIIEQLNDWGKYKSGFINTFIGQKNVVATTTGYNYLALNNDIYLYTGITSILEDESNIGFVLINLRTKESSYYNVPGAEEYSAMASAEGQVQQMKYKATFPLLINLNNRATYLLSLKDNAGLVKMYAFIDVNDYQKVVVTEASLGIEKAASNYLSNTNYGSLVEENIKVSSVTNVVIDGNTIYYLTDNNGNKYKANINVNSDILPFVKAGSNLKISFYKKDLVTDIKTIK